MHATVWPSRIDILGASAVAGEVWEPLLDELKAEHVSSFTPTGKRLSVVLSPSGRLDAFIYRTIAMPTQFAYSESTGYRRASVLKTLLQCKAVKRLAQVNPFR